MIDKVQPIEIDFEELQLEEVIGVGGFGKVYRYIRINFISYKNPFYYILEMFLGKGSNISFL